MEQKMTKEEIDQVRAELKASLKEKYTALSVYGPGETQVIMFPVEELKVQAEFWIKKGKMVKVLNGALYWISSDKKKMTAPTYGDRFYNKTEVEKFPWED